MLGRGSSIALYYTFSTVEPRHDTSLIGLILVSPSVVHDVGLLAVS